MQTALPGLEIGPVAAMNLLLQLRLCWLELLTGAISEHLFLHNLGGGPACAGIRAHTLCQQAALVAAAVWR